MRVGALSFVCLPNFAQHKHCIRLNPIWRLNMAARTHSLFVCPTSFSTFRFQTRRELSLSLRTWGRLTWSEAANLIDIVKNKPEYRGHHRNLAAKQRHYRVPSFHASSSSSSSSSSSLYQVRSNFRISLHSLQRIDITNIQSIHISGMKRERGRRDRGRKIHCLFYVSVSFLCKMFIHCKGLIL